MSQQTRPVNPGGKLLLGAVALTVVAGAAGWGIARAGRGGADGSEGAAAAAPARTTPAPAAVLTPEAALAAIPDPGAATPAAREVARWRARAANSPRVAALWVNLGDALMQLSREQVDPHGVDPAEQAYRVALTLEPASATAMTGMAWVTSVRHQFTESIDWAKRALAGNPKDHAAWGLIGDAQVEKGDYDGAFESYQKMLDIRPDVSSYSRGAHLLYLTGDTRKALYLMELAVKAGAPTAENTAWCRAQLGEMLWSVGAVVPAEAVLREGLKTRPDNYHLLTAMAKVRAAKGDAAGAVASLEKVVARSPQHAALATLADLYASQGKADAADAVFARVEAAATHHQSHGNADELYLARFYADHDRKIDRAAAIVDAAIKASGGDLTNPADADTAAWVYLKAGRAADARRYIDKAVAKGTPDAARLYHAGMIYARSGQSETGRKYLNRALNLNPHFSPLQAPRAAAALREMGAKKQPVAQVARQSGR